MRYCGRRLHTSGKTSDPQTAEIRRSAGLFSASKPQLSQAGRLFCETCRERRAGLNVVKRGKFQCLPKRRSSPSSKNRPMAHSGEVVSSPKYSFSGVSKKSTRTKSSSPHSVAAAAIISVRCGGPRHAVARFWCELFPSRRIKPHPRRMSISQLGWTF
jgi:hypothetical protein